MIEKEIRFYLTASGECPFEKWLRDQAPTGQQKIRIRLQRVAGGNLGNVKGVGDGVHELKFSIKGHPAYRIYFTNEADEILLLLIGGDKSDQHFDITTAKEYWHDYKERKKTAESKL